MPGLPAGLTHAFPEPAEVTPARLAATGIEGADAVAVTALAAAQDPARGPDGTRNGACGLDPDLREYLAFRAGRTEAFPVADPALRAALADLGLPVADSGSGPQVPWPWAEPWRPWLALAAAHLMAHGDTLAGPVPARIGLA